MKPRIYNPKFINNIQKNIFFLIMKLLSFLVLLSRNKPIFSNTGASSTNVRNRNKGAANNPKPASISFFLSLDFS